MAPRKRRASSSDDTEQFLTKVTDDESRYAGNSRRRTEHGLSARDATSSLDSMKEIHETKHAAAIPDAARIVSPFSSVKDGQPDRSGADDTVSDAVRRTLFPATYANNSTATVLLLDESFPKPVKSKRRLVFGRPSVEIEIKDSVKQVYSIVKKLTGSIGGNGCFGPIYGELTMGSMQKMINLIKEHAELSTKSRFIDVGSGIGKPNLHVAQDPGVEFSLGVEVEHDRWLLGMNCLKGVLDAASDQSVDVTESERIHQNCMFVCGDITESRSFDPFTHVYMFSIGFPPLLWCELSAMWNRSSSDYLICYHNARDIVVNYEFDVELVAQTPTSMHGSKEGHTGYVYRRVAPTTTRAKPKKRVATDLSTLSKVDIMSSSFTVCDPIFAPAWNLVRNSSSIVLQAHVDGIVAKSMDSGGTRTRSKNRSFTTTSKCEGK